MSLNSNNQQLQTILDTVNALPDAGGSAAPETCTVTFETDSANPVHRLSLIMVSRFVNGERIDTYVPAGFFNITQSTLLGGWGGIMGNKSGSPVTVSIGDVVVGSVLGLHAETDIAYITTDSNCSAAVNYSDWRDNNSGSYLDPNQMRTTWSDEPVTRSNCGTGSPLAFFKILGDTTIKIWDED